MNPMQSPNTGGGKNLSQPIEIECIGMDRKMHVCEPHELFTKCGVGVLKKKVADQERIKLFSCYECTY